MKKLNRVISIILAVLTLSLLMAQVAYAANSCIDIRGDAEDCDKWYSFDVKTGKNWFNSKITFTQTKGHIIYMPSFASDKTYGAYTIKVIDDDGNVKTYYWKYKQSYKITLKSNTYYTIKIKPYQPGTVGDQNASTIDSWLAKKTHTYNKNNWEWSTSPTWTVKSTKRVTWCE